MRTFARKSMRAQASEHTRNSCEQFEQRPNFASNWMEPFDTPYNERFISTELDPILCKSTQTTRPFYWYLLFQLHVKSPDNSLLKYFSYTPWLFSNIFKTLANSLDSEVFHYYYIGFVWSRYSGTFLKLFDILTLLQYFFEGTAVRFLATACWK